MKITPWCALLAVVVSQTAGSQPPPTTAILFEGARLIVGDGTAPIERSAFIVENNRFTRIGKKGELRLPAGATRVDLSGKTVMPAIVDVHGHPGYRKGATFSADNYTRANLADILNRYAYYGVAAVLEAGTGRGDLPFEVRAGSQPGARLRTTFRGIAMPNAGPAPPMRDAAFGVTTEAEARRDVQELAARKVDLVKIWVDDRGGTVPKLTPPLYRAAIDEAHKHDLRVVAHVVELADAKELLRAGVDGFAHLVRDKDVDNELIGLLKQRPSVFVLPTLWGERRLTYSEKPAWLNAPQLRDTLTAGDIKQLGDSFEGAATPEAGEKARQYWRMLARTITTLNAAGVRLGLGTDTGGTNGGQYFGWASQIEMETMVSAGLTPAQVLVAATRNSAEILRLDELGTIASGKSADFIVLDANPLDDITNTRRIAKVYLRGMAIDRAALKAGWAGRANADRGR